MGRTTALNRAASCSVNFKARLSRSAVSRYGWVAPRSSFWMPCALKPARSATTSCVSPSVRRCCRRSAPKLSDVWLGSIFSVATYMPSAFAVLRRRQTSTPTLTPQARRSPYVLRPGEHFALTVQIDAHSDDDSDADKAMVLPDLD